MPNQYLSPVASVPQMPCFQSSSAFKPVSVWSREQYAPFNTQLISKHPQITTDNGYYNRYDQNVNYESQMPPKSTGVPAPIPQSMDTAGQNWQLQRDIEQFGGVPVSIAYSDGYAMNANYTKPYHGDMKSEKSATFLETASNIQRQSSFTDVEKQKKKVRRPMNSFMIYAKRHRAQVHQLYPLCDNRTVSKILSETWYAMDAEKKQKYHDLAAEIRQEHFRLNPQFKWTTKPNEQPVNGGVEELKPVSDKGAQQTIGGNTPNVQTFGFQFDLNGGLKSPYTPITPSTEKSLSPVTFDDAVPPEPIPEFRLGPTPAQLGLRRKKGQMKTSETVSTENNTASVLNGDADDPSAASGQQHFKQRFHELPQFDFSSYRVTNGWDSSPTSPAISYNTATRKRTHSNGPANNQQKAKRIVGDRFFGPDFNVNNFKGSGSCF